MGRPNYYSSSCRRFGLCNESSNSRSTKVGCRNRSITTVQTNASVQVHVSAGSVVISGGFNFFKFYFMQQLQLFLTSALRGASPFSHLLAPQIKFSFAGKGKDMNWGIQSSSASAVDSGIQRHHVRVDGPVAKGAVEGDSRGTGQTLSYKIAATDSAEQRTLSLSSSNPAYEAQWPLPSAAKTERRTRMHLGHHSEQRSNQAAAEHDCLAKLEAPLRSNSVTPSQPAVSSLTTVSGKMHSSFPSGTTYLRQNCPEPRVGVRESGDSKCMDLHEPFDICLSGSRRPVVLRPTSQEKDRLQGIQMDYSFENAEVLRPGMVLLRSYIPLSQQVDLVMRCRELGLGSGGFYQPGYKDGAKLRLHMMCLGMDWDPQTKKYGKRRHYDNSKPPNIPRSFDCLVRRVLHDSQTLIKQQLSSNVEEILPSMSPNICIVNFYTAKGRLGLHQDRDESRESLLRGIPVVSFSIGDSAEFLYGDQRDADKAERVLLESGDVLIFGGKSRHIFHGVRSINPKTAPPALLECTKLRPGRINLTFRQN